MNSKKELHGQVRAAYSDIALAPGENAYFACGRALAEDVGYPAAVLDRLPAEAVEAFCGVGEVALWADIQPGHQVLDMGCGAGLDTLLAAGRAARVFAVDFSPEMLRRAGRSLEEMGLTEKVKLIRAEAQSLPFPDGSLDVALVNGLFNLNPFREEAFRELARVLRSGGRLYACELVLSEPVPAIADGNWFG